MRTRRLPYLALISLAVCTLTVRASTFDFASKPAPQPLRWHNRTIRVSLSTSLKLPNPAIKPGSDVVGAVRRALKQWSSVANITFVEATSKLQSVSPVTGGDGISLITIAPTLENTELFKTGNQPARTRVFYSAETGEISEADIVLNSWPESEWGIPLQFSTDGTPGTYDLESTLAHEIGHLLGLDHSPLLSSTMNPSQALNGIYGMPAFARRTLSEADRAAVRGIYGPHTGDGAIEGKILRSFGGTLEAVPDAHVWLERADSGRIVASTMTDATGTFRIPGLEPAEYRVLIESQTKQPTARGFRSVQVADKLRVTSGSTSAVDYVFVPPQASEARLLPHLIGTNAELSVVALSAQPGKTLKVYVSGKDVDQVPGLGISTTSPFLTVDAGSLKLEDFGEDMPVISFQVRISPETPAGDYSIKLQAHWGEISYIAGAITIDGS